MRKNVSYTRADMFHTLLMGTKYSDFEILRFGFVYNLDVSEFTLSLMTDSGWYEVDYDYAEPMRFGYKEGIYVTSVHSEHYYHVCDRMQLVLNGLYIL